MNNANPKVDQPQESAHGHTARAGQTGERRCRECGDLLGDAPCELCIACESDIAGETED